MKDEPKKINNELSELARELESGNPKPHEFDEVAAPVSPQVQKIYSAFGKTTRCSDMHPAQLEVSLLSVLKIAADLTRKDISEGIIRTYMRELERDLRTEWQWLRLGELKYLIEQGAKGNYGEVYQLSYMTIYGWMRSYRDSDERKAWIEYAKALEKKRVLELPVPKMTREQFCMQQAQVGWEIYEKTRHRADAFLLMPLPAYEYLETTGKYRLSNEKKLEIKELVIAYLKAQQANRMQPPDQTKFPYVITTDQEKQWLRDYCRRWTVAMYYQSLITNKQKFQP